MCVRPSVRIQKAPKRLTLSISNFNWKILEIFLIYNSKEEIKWSSHTIDYRTTFDNPKRSNPNCVILVYVLRSSFLSVIVLEVLRSVVVEYTESVSWVSFFDYFIKKTFYSSVLRISFNALILRRIHSFSVLLLEVIKKVYNYHLPSRELFSSTIFRWQIPSTLILGIAFFYTVVWTLVRADDHHSSGLISKFLKPKGAWYLELHASGHITLWPFLLSLTWILVLCFKLHIRSTRHECS